MKLIDILVEELPKRGGWPDGAVECCRHNGTNSIDFYDANGNWNDDCYVIYGKDFAKDAIYEENEYKLQSITRDQYEAALAAKNDGWIDWDGGECPVNGVVIVDYKMRDGCVHTEPAYILRWGHRGWTGDIVAYRLHKPQKTEQPEASEQELNECIGQAPATVWNGDGFPPVGMEIEYKFAKANYRTDFSRGKVLAYGVHNVFMEHWASKNEFIQPLDKIEFRPIRSEADWKREEAIMSLAKSGGAASFEYGEKFNDGSLIGAAWYELYDAIAAGKVRGVKLED